MAGAVAGGGTTIVKQNTDSSSTRLRPMSLNIYINVYENNENKKILGGKQAQKYENKHVID